MKPFDATFVLTETTTIMEQPVEMNTLSQILEKLRLKGKDNELKMTDHGKMQSDNGKIYTPEDLTIVKTYRFEGMSDPGDNSVLYILVDQDNEMSYIIDAYGLYSDHDGPAFDDFLKKINTADRDEQELFS
ncbi:hypothetical protein [Pedobacter changchengzhani]|nr:hypothetical protein [Pedobacter changchengzhani]